MGHVRTHRDRHGEAQMADRLSADLDGVNAFAGPRT